MPYYFAYGANMDREAMARRCPGSRALGPGQLRDYRFFITRDGYASVEEAIGDEVHGVVWNLSFADLATLDRFEGVARGLYRRALAPIRIADGRSSSAVIYIASSTKPGLPLPGYVDAVLNAAAPWRLPAAYLDAIRLLGERTRGGRIFRN